MDKFYCIIKLTNDNKLELHCFNNHFTLIKHEAIFNYPTCFSGDNAGIIYSLLCKHSLINYLSRLHILYLGHELCKAEFCYLLNQIYIQN